MSEKQQSSDDLGRTFTRGVIINLVSKMDLRDAAAVLIDVADSIFARVDGRVNHPFLSVDADDIMIAAAKGVHAGSLRHFCSVHEKQIRDEFSTNTILSDKIG